MRKKYLVFFVIFLMVACGGEKTGEENEEEVENIVAAGDSSPSESNDDANQNNSNENNNTPDNGDDNDNENQNNNDIDNDNDNENDNNDNSNTNNNNTNDLVEDIFEYDDWVDFQVVNSASLSMVLMKNGNIVMIRADWEDTEIEPIENINNVEKISAQGGVYFAIKTDGTLWGWGKNQIGQLGDGTIVTKDEIIQIGDESDWKSISTSGSHTIASKVDGSVWGWGRNFEGQLGLGQASGNDCIGGACNPSPIRIGKDNDWSSISAGGNSHSVALKTDGSLWIWGYRFNPYPAQIDDDNNWSVISAGSNHTSALKSDGTIWSWGSNTYGQLGYGIKEYQGIPTKIYEDTDWSIISSGDEHSMALKSNGTLWGWGLNDAAELGIENPNNEACNTYPCSKSPIQINNDTDWINVWASVRATFAVKKDKSLWTWGKNISDIPKKLEFINDNSGENDNVSNIHPITVATTTNDTYARFITLIASGTPPTSLGVSYTFYTTDGTEPTINSDKYYDNSSIFIYEDTIFKFFSIDGEGNKEPVQTIIYTVDPNNLCYKVTGTAFTVFTTYTNSGGGSSQKSNLSLPWEYCFPASGGDFVYIAATNEGESGNVTVTIYRHGSEIETSTSEGAYTTSTAYRLL